MWFRTCQECGHVHDGPWKDPKGNMSEGTVSVVSAEAKPWTTVQALIQGGQVRITRRRIEDVDNRNV
jgi:hypothetical protein